MFNASVGLSKAKKSYGSSMNIHFKDSSTHSALSTSMIFFITPLGRYSGTIIMPTIKFCFLKSTKVHFKGVHEVFRMDLIGYSKGIGVNNAQTNVHDAQFSVQG